jgi:chorismate mutase
MQPATGLIDGERDDAAGAIATARSRIDELDTTIIELVRQRREISLGVQRERIRAGGVRIESAREREIVRRYVAGLGKPGGLTIALGMLDVCRGERPAAAAAAEPAQEPA